MRIGDPDQGPHTIICLVYNDFLEALTTLVGLHQVLRIGDKLSFPRIQGF
jgi:hypothetical protein